MFILKILSYLVGRHSYKGGLQLDQVVFQRFDFEGVILELAVPATGHEHIASQKLFRNFPLKKPDWFQSHCKRQNLNDSVDVFFELWSYGPVWLYKYIHYLVISIGEGMGQLVFDVDLKRLDPAKKLDLNDPRSLADYIIWEYHDFYESPEEGDYCKGANARTRRDCRRLMARDDEWHRERQKKELESRLIPVPRDFAYPVINGSSWTEYKLDRPGRFPSTFCCIPISESFYVSVEITYYYQDRYKELLAQKIVDSADWLKQHIKITFPGKPAGSLALPQ